MKFDLSAYRDPNSGEKLTLKGNFLFEEKSNKFYPILNGIPRFVHEDNYSNNFGLQWNKFKKTQLDSYTNTKISFDRLSRCLYGHINKISEKLVLEAGSGAGRFTEILLQMGAYVHSFDLSNAVDVNYENNNNYGNLILAQASIEEIPFKKKEYDYVICLGVIQHTPNPEESIKRLYEMLKPGGYLIFDHYLFKWRNILPPPIGGANILYRKLILMIPFKNRFKLIKIIVDSLFPIHWYFRKSLLAQRILRRISPLHFYYPEFKFTNKKEYYDWALLDTHDSTTDFYKHHRSVSQIKKFLENIGASEIIVSKGGNGVEAFCRKNNNLIFE